MAELPYDPQKRREYYLENRKLKGKAPGAGSPTTSGSNAKAPPPAVKTAEQMRAETQARVKVLKEALKKLQKVLSDLVKQAKAKTGIEGESSDTPEAKAAAKKKASDLSPQEKKEAAEKAKERYDKTKKPEEDPSKQAEELEAKIAKVREKIEKAKNDLKSSIQQARNQLT